jgi:zinc transporter ZupT
MKASSWLFGLLPVVLAAAFVALFLTGGIPGVFRPLVPPIEKIAFERMVLQPGHIEVSVVNDGPDPVQIAQVLVNGAYWTFTIRPSGPINRLERAVVSIDYPWVDGEPQRVTLVTSTGVTFGTEVEVATETPGADGRYLGSLALLGVYIGVIPVLLGMLWLPFLRVVRTGWYAFFLALTVGLLVFLGFDTVAEALETLGQVPESLKGVGVLVGGFALAYLGLTAAGRIGRRGPAGSAGGGTGAGRDESPAARWALAFGISLGIGVHNLGEGLAVGSAYAVGNISLGALLVVGFTLHNVTEGLAVVAPIAKERVQLARLLGLGLLAGAPAMVGAWVGGLAYSALGAVFFLGIGAGAIFQVAVEIGRYMARRSEGVLLAPGNIAGLLAGVLVMYGTSLLVTA